MDFKQLFESVKELFLSHPALISVGVAAFCIAVLLMLDAHKCKKQRARHRRHQHHDHRKE